MPDHILKLGNVRKTYGDVAAVADVSFALERGEFLSLLGPSGSGKTTTLQLVAGLTTLTSGEIDLEGRSVGNLPPYRRNIGVVFQSYALFPHLSVRRNIAFPLEMRHTPKAEIAERVERVLELVDLAGYGDRLPAQLSGGQQQRVALARAMVFRPSILLMDEPLGALDKKMREHMQLEIKHLHRQHGMSIIYVTHDQEEALTMSDRVAVFNRGRIEQMGRPSDLYEAPATRFVAGFIGETTLIDGTITEVSGDDCLAACGGIRVSGRRPPGAAAGRKVTVSIRPERVHLTAGAPGGEQPPNSGIGRIEDIIYLGGSRKYILDIGGSKLTILEHIRQETAGSHREGDSVRFFWDAADATIITE